MNLSFSKKIRFACRTARFSQPILFVYHVASIVLICVTMLSIQWEMVKMIIIIFVIYRYDPPHGFTSISILV